MLHQLSNQSLEEQDQEIYNLIQKEIQLQDQSLNLIPSENYTSKSVSQALGCVFSTRYAPGPQGSKYAPQVENYDEIEKVCHLRALSAFQVDSQEWGVNVQMGSGSTANLALLLGLLQPHDRIMSMSFQQGGHFSHGYEVNGKKLSAVSKIFEVLFYELNEQTQIIDYDGVEKMAKQFKPKLIIAGCSAYSRLIDFERFRQICDQVGALLLADISHTAGLMAAQVIPGPFKFADVVMTTTHKSLRGPRGSLIFYKLKYKNQIDESVAPGLVAGAHFHTITAIAVALKESQTTVFKEFQKQVLINNAYFAECFKKLGYSLIGEKTENHLILLDLRKYNTDANKIEYALSQINIQCNKNSVPFDVVNTPRALRIGSIPLTARGALPQHFEQVVNIIHKIVLMTEQIQNDLKDWTSQNQDQLLNLKQEVLNIAKQLPIPYQ